MYLKFVCMAHNAISSYIFLMKGVHIWKTVAYGMQMTTKVTDRDMLLELMVKVIWCSYLAK